MLSYHLWVMPSGAAYDLLTKTIAELSEQYQAPRFAPHVTLLGHLLGSEAQILARGALLAQRLRSYEIRLTVFGMTERYFQCLFLHVERTVAAQEAHSHAVSIFSPTDTAPYYPHLSLLYGTFPADLKQQIVKALPSGLALQFPVDRLQVIRAGSKDPRDWTVIRTIRFGPGGAGG